jgi:hypothetical protein
MRRVLAVVWIVAANSAMAQEENHLKGAVQPEAGSVNQIEELSQKVASLAMEVQIYPNPSQGQVSVEGEEGATVTVYSSEGTYVGTWLIGPSGRTDVSDLPTGTFLCTVSKGDLRTVKQIVVL